MHYLFERLNSVDSGPARAQPLAQAVAAQIQRIVATRPRAADDTNDLLGFGMLSVVDVSAAGGAGLRRYAARLARMIERFEPRLENVEIALVPDRNPLMPNRLSVSGTLRHTNGEALRVLFDAENGIALESDPS
ncbi:type VI secretion system baseplate subunit TssE [Trinickia caryophylli]|uniref:Type VI secretion system lysozyme-like protein n=1 Tax=Trinickia caryophylli TaxID=28094 RepID=A0A1X7D673_TRICW|nr:type VI secretion system baseplate subunit TssE [Trinickia caryophylli]PMS12711.1 type VI secretion system baseplate subunit TssE [Trinickia caryophylli]TRX15116.1 type VI secretion system baseplate subunit TssE [Trinickia caryophylli]WQE14977.1 type VI secretion system baseplate subunit TssE [Trinickia caryophylli]SMF09236.1 type VI secretion system lysozyme-like protein [Trinickia caryophylli]GLU31294.1 hypothetical protein Busp01_11360 [Trinickia caryophylli]